ncbi:MAG TPA: hypothetical protein VKY38_00770 [Azoarcus sp.]|nr:hypothetical protein [Azoarcus sp.]
MTRETIWLIIAGVAALVAVPLLYIGLGDNNTGLMTIGFALFTAGMLIAPLMRLFQRK